MFKKTYEGVMDGFKKTIQGLNDVITQEEANQVKLDKKQLDLEEKVTQVANQIAVSGNEVDCCQDTINTINKLFPKL